jgi:hypothetical protein
VDSTSTQRREQWLKRTNKLRKMAKQQVSLAAKVKAKTGAKAAQLLKSTTNTKHSSSWPTSWSRTVYAPGVTPPSHNTPSRSTPEIKGVGQGLRVAGENGISKGDFKTIAETTGKES